VPPTFFLICFKKKLQKSKIKSFRMQNGFLQLFAETKSEKNVGGTNGPPKCFATKFTVLIFAVFDV